MPPQRNDDATRCQLSDPRVDGGVRGTLAAESTRSEKKEHNKKNDSGSADADV